MCTISFDWSLRSTCQTIRQPLPFNYQMCLVPLRQKLSDLLMTRFICLDWIAVQVFPTNPFEYSNPLSPSWTVFFLTSFRIFLSSSFRNWFFYGCFCFTLQNADVKVPMFGCMNALQLSLLSRVSLQWISNEAIFLLKGSWGSNGN